MAKKSFPVLPEGAQRLEFPNGLPEGFVLGKPIEQANYKEADIYRREQEHNLIITRKRDGYKIYALVQPNGVRLYTSGMNKAEDRLAHIKAELEDLKLPPGTIVVGEAVINVNGKDNDSITDVGSIFKKECTSALAIQARNGYLHYMIFGIVSWGGDVYYNGKGEVITMSFDKQLELIDFFLRKAPARGHIFRVPILNCSFDEAKRDAVQKGWEGLVLYHKDFQNVLRLEGLDPKRPKGCEKWKPILEGDFICRFEDIIWNPDKPGRIKEVRLLQIDPVTKQEFSCFKLGTFTEKMRASLAESNNYPLVMQVAFETRFEKTGKLRNARFMRLRDDKPLHECLAPQSYPEREVIR